MIIHVIYIIYMYLYIYNYMIAWREFVVVKEVFYHNDNVTLLNDEKQRCLRKSTYTNIIFFPFTKIARTL